MFLRTVWARGGGGVKHEYIRLVEAYREGGKVRQRVVANIGRVDLLAPFADRLLRILKGEKVERVGGAEAQAWDWGPVLVARSLWRELGLGAELDRLEAPARGASRGALADRAFVLVANRLCRPCSEHGLARWLETDFVCDRHGERYLPEWREDAERLASARPRVRVEMRQLKRWYRTLDQLLARKRSIEEHLYARLRDLFSLKADLVFYDVTSTYFEGRGPMKLGRHGYSRDGKPRNRQVLVGLVMVGGWPIAHHVFAGNRLDGQTVPSVLEDLERRFGLRRVVFVGDRGMVTADNIALLRKRKQGYVVGLKRRRQEEVFEYIRRATGPWQECPVGITAREKSNPPRTLVQEVPSNEDGVRVFVVQSEERLGYERTRRLESMRRVREELEALAARVQRGALKAPEKIGAAAARILSRNHGGRYYAWEIRDGKFHFFESPHLEQEEAYEGKYVIQTEEQDLTPVQAVQVYKELGEVERAFRHLKDILDVRPIWHQNDDRVQAHIFVAALAFLIERTIEKKLKAVGLDLSAEQALEALRTVRLVELELGPRETRRIVTRGTARAAAVLNALGITDRDPPAPTGAARRAVW